MYKTEQEIFSQYEALKRTYDFLKDKTDSINSFINNTSFKSITFIGSGSSYSLCKSAELSIKIRTGMQANSIPAGDLLVNFQHYRKLIKDTLLVAPSRSGSTSEVILAVKRAKEEFNTPCICISARSESELSKIADLDLELPWAFDESVCQTRTVTNLYMTNLFLVGIISGDTRLIEEIGEAVEHGEEFIRASSDAVKEISQKESWENVVTLADSELEGIVEEGALAFKEICQLQSNYYHLLDVRHGPAVLIGSKTLVIAVISPNEDSYQKDLIRDLKKQGAVVVTVSNKMDNYWGGDHNFTVPSYQNFAVTGIPFIFIPQAISYYKALARNINPDLPQGLDPWIKL